MEAEMLKVLLRAWFVVTLGWIAYNGFLHREKIRALRFEDWVLAFQSGVNNLFCDLKVAAYCTELAIPLFKRSSVAETFGLIVIMVGYPVLAFIACFIIAWIARPAGKSGCAATE
jgi:hypothetical protein